MYVIIIGGGRIGKHLAKILINEGHDIVVVDKDGDVCHEIAKELDALTVRGDATRPEVMEDAGIDEADAIVSLTGSDETNLVVGLIAKQMGAKDVGIRLGALHYDEEVLKRLGIDKAIYPASTAAGYISEMITKPEVLDLSFVERGNAVILELEVLENSKIAGKKVKDAGIPEEASVTAVYRDGSLEIPSPDMEITPGDKVLMLTKKDKIKSVKKLGKTK